jgi:protein-disulfide isomerase
MLRLFRRPSLALCAVLVLSSACLSERGGTPVKPGAAGSAATTGTATAQRKPATLVAVDPKETCAAAALTIKPGTVVGKMRGADITVEQLGEELAAIEHQALRTYCNAIIEARTTLLDNHVQRTLLEEVAKAENKTIQEYIEGRVDALVPTPDDLAITTFYETNKSPETPPLEMVRDQVIKAMTGEQRNAAIDSIIAEIEGKNGVERLMPDIALPPVDLSTGPSSPTIGPKDAVVQVTEFSDFECPYCSRAAETLGKLKDKYAGASVQFVFRHYPLPMHPNAQPAAEYGQCAQAQGKFWPMHDAIFAAQRELSGDKLKELAAQAGLDGAALEACLAGGGAATEVAADMAKGREVGVEGTPSFFINGQPFAGNPNVEGLSKAIDAELAKAQRG